MLMKVAPFKGVLGDRRCLHPERVFLLVGELERLLRCWTVPIPASTMDGQASPAWPSCKLSEIRA